MTSEWKNKHKNGAVGVPGTAAAMATKDDGTEYPTLAPFAGKGNGKKGPGKGRGTTPERNDGKKGFCIQFQTGSCTRGDTCTYSHDTPKDSAELQKMLKVACAQNGRLNKKLEGANGATRNSSPAPGKGDGKGKKRPDVNFCIKFLKKVTPPCDGMCGKDHLTQPEINEKRKSLMASQPGL
jgi:hypothetical protein